MEFQPTLPARGATIPRYRRAYQDRISTHAPRTGSDAQSTAPRSKGDYFNPRSPHGERQAIFAANETAFTFQPTLPARGATGRDGADAAQRGISTHAPRTGSDCATGHSQSQRHRNFNPRSPHGERPHREIMQSLSKIFQPTLPARGATIAF